MLQTRLELDITFSAGCAEPGCTAQHPHEDMYMEPGCHPGSGIMARYSVSQGVISMYCSVCDAPVVAILVAKDHKGG